MYSRKHREENAHDDGIWCCAWSKFARENLEIICTGSVDDTIKIWSWQRERFELRHTCEGHKLGVISLDMNHDGSVLADSGDLTSDVPLV